MSEGYEPNPSHNWTKFYDHVMENANVTLPTEYSELLCIGYATNSGGRKDAYTIIIYKQMFIEVPDETSFRTGYYINENDCGAWSVKKINNTTISPRYVQADGGFIADSYLRLYYR